MAFIVVYDANVLYPNTLRDLLIRIAQLPHLVQAKWTDKILDEMLTALRKNLPDISEEKASRLRELMNAAVRDCLVEGTSLSSQSWIFRIRMTGMCLLRLSGLRRRSSLPRT